MRHFCLAFDYLYLPRGLALYTSLKRHCQDFSLHVLCMDARCKEKMEELALPECCLHSLEELEVADSALLRTKEGKSITDYSFTLKPCLLKYLLARMPEGEWLTYMDADLYFFSDPEPLFAEMGNGSAGIIAHRFLKEFAHMTMHGIHNAGWVSIRNDEAGNRCNNWWRERCLEWCFNRIENGIYADQSYLDDWPSRFPSTVVVTHPGANVAPWNIDQYRLEEEVGMPTIDGSPLVFYHFHALHRLRKDLFDGQTSQYGVDMSDALRRLVYLPYLQDLREVEIKLRTPLKRESNFHDFELLPQLESAVSGVTREQAETQAWLYQKLVVAEKDRAARLGVILELDKACQKMRKALQK